MVTGGSHIMFVLGNCELILTELSMFDQKDLTAWVP